MPYSVVDDDTNLQVRASIPYDDQTEELLSLILLLQDRLAKKEKLDATGSADPVQSLQPGSAGTAGTGTERADSASAEDSSEASYYDQPKPASHEAGG